MVLLKPIDKTLFIVGTPHPSLAQTLEGPGVLDELQISVCLMIHGDATDGISVLVPPRV